MSHKPLVSIAIPSYKASFFEQALKSAIGQTYEHIEIIVSDNCPSESISEICQKYPNVQYRRNPLTRGDNVLDVFFSAKGEYVKPLFDDDILHPFCIERMVDELYNFTEAALVFSASTIISNKNKRSRVRRPGSQSALIEGKELQRQMILSFKNFIGEFSTIMFKKSALENFSRQNALFYRGKEFSRGLGDVVFYWNIARNDQALYIDEELSYFRFDPEHNSNSNPESNPEFIYAITDWIDLLITSHEAGVITDSELTVQGAKQARSLIRYWSRQFPAVTEFGKKFDDYLKRITQQ